MLLFLDKQDKRKIYYLISENPGIGLGRIADMLHLNIADVQLEVQSLKKKRAIRSAVEGDSERYYIDISQVKSREDKTQKFRIRIFLLVTRNPGIHLSKIAETLEISIALADYHLSQMQKNGEILALKDATQYYKRYYVSDSGLGSHEKQVLGELRKKVPLHIIFLLLKQPVMKHKDLLEHVHVSSSTLSYHLSQLVDHGILSFQSQGDEKGYSLKDREEVINILKKYALNIEFNLAVERFNDLWKDFTYGELPE